jgi:uncharacterized protein YbjT (DUF2867 family)
MTDGAVLVTGATGKTGRLVVEALAERGLDARAGSRRPAEGEARFDFLDRSTWAPALDGVEGVFLVRPPALSDVRSTLNPFVDAARARGAKLIVFLSVAGADEASFIPHARVEAHLRADREDYTFLRAGFFAQNFEDAYRDDVREDHRIYVPAGRGRVAFVDLRDVAELAGQLFADPGKARGLALTLTGPETYDFHQAAGVLSDVSGHAIRYQPASVWGYARHLRKRGRPWGQVAVQTALHIGLRFGQAAQIDPTLEALLGRRPRSLEAYLRDRSAHIFA